MLQISGLQRQRGIPLPDGDKELQDVVDFGVSRPPVLLDSIAL
jgi:hypothetical protein